MKDKIVVFGAGATGRGHVGLLAWQAGFKIVFVDKDYNLVETLKRAGEYKVKIYGKQHQEIVVSDYRVYHSDQRNDIAEEITDACLVLTTVFDQNLEDVAKTIALAVLACRKASRKSPLNFIACENMQDSSSTLGKHARAMLNGEELVYFDRYLGFPDSMISRVVPKPEPDPLVIVAEDYNEWTARAEAFKGEKPAALTALELVDNQTARLERKFFIHNGGHAVCGYIGFHRKHKYVHEAVADSVVAEHVLGALDELGQVVQRKHGFNTPSATQPRGFSAESIESYKQDFCRRGAIPEMQDQILRVVRQPIRKLSEKERLVAPAKLALEYNLPRKWIIKGIVATLKYHHPDDQQSLTLVLELRSKGLTGVLREICGINENSPLASEIKEAWDNWSI